MLPARHWRLRSGWSGLNDPLYLRIVALIQSRCGQSYARLASRVLYDVQPVNSERLSPRLSSHAPKLDSVRRFRRRSVSALLCNSECASVSEWSAYWDWSSHSGTTTAHRRYAERNSTVAEDLSQKSTGKHSAHCTLPRASTTTSNILTGWALPRLELPCHILRSVFRPGRPLRREKPSPSLPHSLVARRSAT